MVLAWGQRTQNTEHRKDIEQIGEKSLLPLLFNLGTDFNFQMMLLNTTVTTLPKSNFKEVS